MIYDGDMKNLHGLSGGWSHGASAGSSRLVNRQEVCIINALPLTEQEELKFKDVASGAQQYFVGDEGLDKDLPSELTDKATVILGNLQVSQVKRCKRIAWLQTASAGVNNYEMDGVLPKTAMITSAAGAYGQEVSEHMFAMMWALMKRLPNYRDQQRENIWQDRGPVATVRGAKVLIVGTGDIGSHFAQLVKAVGGKRSEFAEMLGKLLLVLIPCLVSKTSTSCYLRWMWWLWLCHHHLILTIFSIEND